MAERTTPAEVPVYLETGKKRVFACSLDWPGWCRSGRDEHTALTALADYVDRYAAVPAQAGQPFVLEDFRLAVVERLPGTMTTDFGAPDVPAERDAEPVDPADGVRLAALLEASWQLLDQVAAQSAEELRKGPRGGGRDRTAIVAHVVAAEFSYARKLGVRHRAPRPGEVADVAAIAAMRSDLVAVVRAGGPADPVRGKAWPVRYAVRRTAWHALDHAWEIEDRQLRG
jgi:hypothetical protein